MNGALSVADPSIKTIVVPTDCSQLSLNALRYADKIASRHGALIVAVYGAVFESPGGEGVAAGLASAYDREMMMAPVRKCIEDGLAHTLSPSTPREIVLEDCEAADAIVSTAHSRAADLIIIGTHDRNRLMRAVLGSVTDSVLRRSRCPVLVLREHNRANGDIRRVVSVASASERAKRIADASGAELVVDDSVSVDDAADLIVVGSDSSPIIRTAHCPVLVVKQ